MPEASHVYRRTMNQEIYDPGGVERSTSVCISIHIQPSGFRKMPIIGCRRHHMFIENPVQGEHLTPAGVTPSHHCAIFYKHANPEGLV